MDRTVRFGARAAVVAAMIVASGVPRADAHVAQCSGTGTFTWDSGAFELILGGPADIGGCVGTTGVTPLMVDGTLGAICGLATGSGAASDGVHSTNTDVTWVGTTLTFAGGMNGVFQILTPFVPGCTRARLAVAGSAAFN